MENTTAKILTSAVRAATNSSDVQQNYNSKGLHLVINMTSVPTVDTVTPSIVGVVNGVEYTILTGPAIVAAGVTVLKVYPGIAAIANASASDILPHNWKVTMTHSAATNFTYSVHANLQA